MRYPALLRWVLVLGPLALAGCGYFNRGPETKTDDPPAGPTTDAIPPAKLDATLAFHFDGVGAMEQYRYGDAVASFRKVRSLAPNWTPGKLNLAIALLNDVGAKSEAAKTSGDEVARDNFTEALELLGDVLERDEANLTARYCRGVILQYLGEIRLSHDDFQEVVRRDPTDGHAWYRLGATLPDPDRPGFRAGLKQAPELVSLYEKALERSPYLVPAYYSLQQALGWSASQAKSPEERKTYTDRQQALLKDFQRLNTQQNPVGVGERGSNVYGEMGPNGRLLGPAPPTPNEAVAEVRLPTFDDAKPLGVALAPGDVWMIEARFTGEDALLGAIRKRFGAAAIALDADGDGRQDLYLAGAIRGPEFVRDALLLNRGDGRFEDASAAFGLPIDWASIGVAAGDFDADGHIDLFLTGIGRNKLLRNLGGGRFEDVTEASGLRMTGALSLTARWLDLDQDGDLDLYVVNLSDAEGIEAADAAANRFRGRPNAAFRNDGKPSTTNPQIPPQNVTPAATATDEQSGEGGLSIAFTPWPEADALLGGDGVHTGIAALDIDDDRDIDLVLTADDHPATIVLNDRLGRFRAVEGAALDLEGRYSGLLVVDLDNDGRPDVVALDPGTLFAARRNTTTRQADGSPRIAFERAAAGGPRWRTAAAADLDLDGRADLVGLMSQRVGPNPSPGEVEWSPAGTSRNVSRTLPGSSEFGAFDFVLADLAGDPLPDVLRLGADPAGPMLSTNRGNGRNWLAIDLGGRWKFSFDHMRTNPHGLGTKVALEGKDLFVPFVYTTNASGPGQSIAPFVLGMGHAPSAALLHLTWPDGVMQAELHVAANQKLVLAERNRKTGSCPVLFAWDGRKFACVGDFLGGGGLGYLVEPGVYSDPDRDEAVSIPMGGLVAEQGTLRLQILEPMDEIAYLDQLTLDTIDTPPDIAIAPDERFAPGGNRPTGRILAWRDTIRPAKATDLRGSDISGHLRASDRVTVDDFGRLKGWIGYAEEHGIILDFADRLAKFGPDDRLVLALSGWVEYPYSQTNYAASTAGVRLQPPVLERLRDDGSWELLEADPGYPAGLPRLTTLELTGALAGPRCVLRLRTNMECYWDEAFVAILEPNEPIRTTTLRPGRAALGYRGFVREVSPDGRLPLLYDYDQVDPAPLARFRGKLTRHGDVRELIEGDDDRLCLVGPGDELALEFDEAALPELPAGWTRRFVLRAVGYCKDADPFTAGSDDVGPWPWKGMPSFPFADDVTLPDHPDPGQLQTRPAGKE